MRIDLPLKRILVLWLVGAASIVPGFAAPAAQGAAPHSAKWSHSAGRSQYAAQTQSATVHSACYWCETGIAVTQGHHYRITVHFPAPNDCQAVKDSYLPVNDLTGWPSPARIFGAPIFFLRRAPQYPWFSLIATVDRQHPVRILPNMCYQASASGELVCYFNDASWAYGNNHGSVTLSVAELTPRKKR